MILYNFHYSMTYFRFWAEWEKIYQVYNNYFIFISLETTSGKRSLVIILEYFFDSKFILVDTFLK